jgi:signal transduction histidine kinase
MSLATILAAASAVMLYAGSLHLLVGIRRNGDAKHLSFAIAAILFACFVAATIGEASATILEDGLRWSKLKIAFSLSAWIAFIWFVRYYTSYIVRPLQWLLTTFFGACLAAHLLRTEGILYTMPSLESVSLPWGETVAKISGQTSQAVSWIFVAFGVTMVYFAIACVAQYRKGKHRQASYLAMAFVIVWLTTFDDLYPWPGAVLFLDELGFLAVVVIMAISLSDEMIRAERKLRRLADNLEELVADRTAALKQSNRNLTTANAKLEAFSFSVSHDLQAPVRRIWQFANIISKGQEDQSKTGHYIERVKSNAEQATTLIQALLRFFQLGRQPLRMATIEPRSLVDEVWERVRPDEGHSVELTVSALPKCRADADLLREVYSNLLDNAVKFSRSRDPARIEVSADLRNGTTVYFVRDNGIGFDMTRASRLFQVFQSLHSREQYPGSGIGLSLVREIVERHGGRIWAEAAPDTGATFFFTLEEPIGDVTMEPDPV